MSTLGALVIGHGSLHAGSGAAMIRVAARLHDLHNLPLTGAGFLNFSEPSFEYALQRLINKGAQQIVVVPYFLVPGYFVRVSLAEKVAAAQKAYNQLQLAEPMGDHQAMADLVVERAQAAAPATPLCDQALLIMVHGSPHPESNAPIYHVAERIRQAHAYALVRVCFMDHNAPSIREAIAEAAQLPINHVIAVPYFLQAGGHVREDLPAAIEQARNDHPQLAIMLGHYLGYHPLIAHVLADRIRQQG